MNKKNIAYLVFSIVTVLSFSGLTTWAVVGNNEDSSKTIETELRFDAKMRREYLVGEELDTSNIKMVIDDETIITDDEYKVKYDFSTAGDKVVEFTYDSNDTSYVSYMKVETFMVRHLDVHQKIVKQKQDGSWDTSELVVWAELSKKTSEFPKPDAFPNIKDTVIILNESQYGLDITPQEQDGIYLATVKVGRLASSFLVSDSSLPQVNSVDRILKLRNASNTVDKLTLYVTDSSSNFAPPNGSSRIDVNGIYILEDALGNERRYRFNYSIDGWFSSFKSEQNGEGLKDYQGYDGDHDKYSVEVNGLLFYAEANEWHKAILNM
jgi:hypothetical protein